MWLKPAAVTRPYMQGALHVLRLRVRDCLCIFFCR
jgi:hypothetical protein